MNHHPHPPLWKFKAHILLALLLSLLTASALQAQTYPAVVNLVLQPPYSPYLSDFLQPLQERVLVQVNFLDQSEPSWEAKLRMTIEGNGLTLRTSRTFYQPITLSPGPNLVDLPLLENLFDFSKMDVQGINKTDLVNAGRLPEGTYQLCIDVVDASREVPFSTPGCFTATLIQNNPPQLVTPDCGAVISAAGSPSIFFNWIPMHDPSIQVRYEMKLVQVPPGMNPNDAINTTSFPILDWLPILGTSFTYGPEQVPLDVNQKYAFQLRVVDVMGLTTFENDGKSPVCWFTYGYSTDGTIDLTAPASQARVENPDKVDFAWSGPSNATPGQQLKYHIKVVKLNPGENFNHQSQGEAIMARTSGVWYHDSTGIMPNIFGGSLTVEQPLEPDARYAWQVHSSTDGLKTAKSPVWEFKAPPVIFAFWVADGAYMIHVTNTTNYTKVSETKYTNLTGTGKVVLAPNEQPTEVSYSGLTVELVANKWVLKVGEVVVTKTESKELDFGDYGEGTYEINAWVLTPMEFLAQGQVKWRFPLSVNAPGNAVVVSQENARLNYLNKVLSGAVTFAENQSYNLLIPMGFSVAYKLPSQFIVAPGGAVTLKMHGDVGFPSSLKTISGDPYRIPFENVSNPWYMEIARMTPSDNLKLFSNTKMTLQPKSFVIDFSGSQSPQGQFQADPGWVGVYVTEYNIFLPTDLDEKDQISLTEPQVLTYVSGEPGYQPAWISAGGLNLDVTATFEKADAAPYYARVNTFKGKFSALRLKIQDNSLSDSKFTGFVKVPFLDPGRKLDWIAPIAANGIQTGYFHEDSVKAFSKTYNPTDSMAKVTLAINQAVFKEGNHIDLNVDLDWPYMQVKLERTSGLKVWGNDQIGFHEPNGKKDLPQQVPVTLGTLNGVADGVGAYYENTIYGFSMFTQVSLPSGMSCPGTPIKVAVAGPGGGAPPELVYTRIDGKEMKGKFRIGPAKISFDNSLVMGEIFADFIDDDKDFGSRFEAKGNIKVKQPSPIVATARIVISQKNSTKFWYMRCAAQGLNKVIEAYPEFSLNGFDFKIYHHLSRPQGSAFVQPNQFNDFWNLNAQQDASNSIEGHTVDGNVMYGHYGKLGIHDTYSGKKHKNAPIKIEEGMPQLGDILPHIPGFCDLQYKGKSICAYARWPWEGLSLCDIKVPSSNGNSVEHKSICQVDLFSVNWPTLQFCDLKLPNGKKLCDFSLGELGFGDINLCDIKLPNGSGLCDYFDIKGKVCDIRTTSGSICDWKLSVMLPSLPPFPEWKIPGLGLLLDFKIGKWMPHLNLCDIQDASGKPYFCDWTWPGTLPDIPNPCDLKLPNGQKLCSLSLGWCDIQVPVTNGGQVQLKPLCDVKWWELDWPNVNVCDWKVGGQSLCNVNLKFCDLQNPLTDAPICDLVPSLCDIREPVSGKWLCDLPTFGFDWQNINFCDFKWPGTERKLCALNLGLCDLKNPLAPTKSLFCDLRLPNLLPSIPNLCDIEVKLPSGSYKKLCSLTLNLDLPSICDLKLPNDAELCKIKLPDLDIPEVPIPTNLPGIPGLPENMYQFLVMGGLRVEVENSGAIRQISVDANGWFYTYRLDPNSSYIARGFGGIEFWPQQKKIQLHMEGETGAVKTDIGTIKPVCGEGEINGQFTPEDWYLDVGKASKPWEVELGCVSALKNSGYIKARPSGIIAHGEIKRQGETRGGFDIGIADIEFWAKAHLDIGMDIGVSFDEPAIKGGISADAGASAGLDVDPDVGDDFSLEFARVNVGGRLNFKVGESLCLSGKLYGEVSVLGQGVDIHLGVKVRDGSISFPENPSSCY